MYVMEYDIRGRSWSNRLVAAACEQGGCSGMHDRVHAGTLVLIFWVVLYRIYVLHLYMFGRLGALYLGMISRGYGIQLCD